MGCGALGHVDREAGVSTRKASPTSPSSLCRWLLKRPSDSDLSGDGGQKGGSSFYTSTSSGHSRQAAWCNGPLESDDFLCSSGSDNKETSTSLASPLTPNGSGSGAVYRDGAKRFNTPPQDPVRVCVSSPTSCPGIVVQPVAGAGEASPHEVISKNKSWADVSVVSTSDLEDTSWWEPPLSGAGSSCSSEPPLTVSKALPSRWRDGEADRSPSQSSCCRSRASPLGGLAEPLSKPRSGAVEFTAEPVRPLADEDWLQAGTSSTARTIITPSSSSKIGDAGGVPRRLSSSDDSSCCSAVRSESGERRVSDSDESLRLPRLRVRLRKDSDADGSVVTTNSGQSGRSTEDTATDRHTDSLPDLSMSDHMPLFDDRCSDASEGLPDSAAALAASSNSACAAGDWKEDDFAFMLERPFAGLETILEDQDSDNEEHQRFPDSPDRLAMRTATPTARQSASLRTGFGHSGPVGDPASSGLQCSPEPLFQELSRAAPCAEVDPGILHNTLKPSVDVSY